MALKREINYNERMKIYVIILNWNGREDTLACLSSLAKVKTPHEVVVVDNGSTDDSARAISASFPNVHLIQTGENLGYAEGNNVGIREAIKQGAEALLILNNDTTVEETILEGFLKRDLPIQGGHARLMDSPDILDHLGGKWNPQKVEFDLVGVNQKVEQWTEPTKLDYACGVALFVKRKVFETVGLFDPRFFLFWEESDWCFRAQKQGFSTISCPEAVLYHKRSASFKGGKPHIAYFWWRNRLLFLEKNFSGNQEKMLKGRVLKEFRHMLKLYCLKIPLAPFRNLNSKKREELRLYRSAISGVKDYYFRKFGNCPSWVLSL